MDSLVGPGTINDLFNYTTSHIHYPKNSQNPIPNYHYLDKNSGARSSAIYGDIASEPGSEARSSCEQENFYGKNIIEKARLLVNGRSRFGERGSEYFNLVEPLEHHYRGPKSGINMYSFSLYPEDHQPSSTLNMSKIDYICMQMHLHPSINAQNTVKIRSYTINYNILRICFGLGGLVFV